MKIGFLINQIDDRGTGNAVYNYAHYNEEILGNKSTILTFGYGAHSEEALSRFSKRFGQIYFMGSRIPDIDALYHIKSGANDGALSDIPYLVHSVFEYDPHGTRYAVISKWMSDRSGIPYVPHIVELPRIEDNYRRAFDIPKNAVVFGRYGALDTFDLPFVWEAISKATFYFPNIYFLFMNTNKPDDISLRRTRFLDGTLDPRIKAKFINTCDYMIHARARGETFGLSVGEFSILGKPVLTYALSGEKAHIAELGNSAILYYDKAELLTLFNYLSENSGSIFNTSYTQYTPGAVMEKFKRVFLDAS